MAYEEKFRKRAVEFKDDNNTFSELKKVFEIDDKTYYNWKKLFGKTGKYTPKKVEMSRKRKIDKEELSKIIERITPRMMDKKVITVKLSANFRFIFIFFILNLLFLESAQVSRDDGEFCRIVGKISSINRWFLKTVNGLNQVSKICVKQGKIYPRIFNFNGLEPLPFFLLVILSFLRTLEIA